ncbi:acyl-CoA thioesterase domain-containing protein [Blastococcus sp. TF02A-26]|uniref:acyl-CoA thioesterase domain-containing protein n=1 Tax=Blastococcus sp. TF02A-26 TaxID=2250577 RepID=UPI000DE872FF|nr:acyl-CoA thioesterase domain-containing protein [Blastococcus sp. TF02A-26]RBY84364.1 hypothetical protein DQ240_14680 [Blastococcus sp. TF02A-26]
MAEPAAWPAVPLPREGGPYVVGAEVTNAIGVLFGGWNLGLAVQAATDLTGGRLRDLSLSHLRPVRAGSELLLSARSPAPAGSLAHVGIEGRGDDGVAFSALAVTGPPAGSPDGPPAPDVAAPEDCPPRAYAAGPGTGSSVLLDVRVAEERVDLGVASWARLWARVRCPVADDVRLAVVSDHVPYLLRCALPRLTGMATVAATVRAFGLPVGEWVLLGVSLVAVDERMGVGRVSMWSDGRLVGVAEQTGRLFTRRLAS